MPYQRGDIVEVGFLMPHNNRIENHPVVIISNDEVYDADQCYIGVMLKTQTHEDRFTFRLTDDMLRSANNQKYAQVRCHLISYFLGGHIITNSNRNKMKHNAVNKLVTYVTDSALF